MASRTPFRLLQLLAILIRLPSRIFAKRSKPFLPNRILIIHQLFLGDTLMLTPLLAKLRERFQNSEIYMAMPESFVSIYSKRPYGVIPVPFNPSKCRSFFALLKLPKIDWAFVPGDNRYGWTAFALGSRWIIGFEGDRPAYKNWCFDELIPYPNAPQSLPDMFSNLVEGTAPRPFRTSDWIEPPFETFALPDKPYVLFHIGTKSPLKSWQGHKWHNLIKVIKSKGFKIAISCGPGETAILEKLELHKDYTLYPGNLNLSQMWKLIKEAQLLICPDNGIAHMGRIIGTPTVCLVGPASDFLVGTSTFWTKSPFQAISKPLSCRNQHNIFKRHISWIQTCERSPLECSKAKCMNLIEVSDVLDAIEKILKMKR